jgi:LEA14-like dessication related protein
LKKNIGYALFLVLFACSCKAPKDLEYRSVDNFGIKQAGAGKTAISLDILLYNPNKYAMKLKDADLDIFLNGNLVGKMKLKDRLKIPKADTFSLPVTVDVDLKTVFSNALQLLFNSEVDIKLNGKIHAGRHGVLISIPVDYQGKQDIRSGLKF